MAIERLFPGTRTTDIDVGGTVIHVRIGGEGPPVLLLHGFPQTHAMWHPLAPALMRDHTCVMPDLRGYGRSSAPAGKADPAAYAKRVMAQDMIGVMAALGFPRFAVVGHDRGGRVAYRMALDHPDAVACLAVLDIVPTHSMWDAMNAKMAMKAYHWPMLAQPWPLPEMLLEHAAVRWLDHTLASWTGAKDLAAFDDAALADYRDAFSRPERVHAMCNDYRAGATVDLDIDASDRQAGRLIDAPTLALWGTAGFPSEASGPLETWRQWCRQVEGQGVDAGHFIVEENAAATLAALQPFLRRHAGSTMTAGASQ